MLKKIKAIEIEFNKDKDYFKKFYNKNKRYFMNMKEKYPLIYRAIIDFFENPEKFKEEHIPNFKE